MIIEKKGNQMKDKKKDLTLQGHFIANSHLDREWGMDYQQTRKLTVDFLDTMLELFEKYPQYTFLLDSQTLPLEDYLEIRPENEERIAQAVSKGQLFIGPWYSAPDTNCITGESIVRNLLMGHRVAARFGEPMKVGYTPFGWGQMAQLPQIYMGFGIDTAFFYRGISKADTASSEYQWEAPDGTKVLASRFGSAARYNFYMFIWRPVLYKGKTIGTHLPDRLYDWSEGGVPFKFTDQEHRYDHYFLNEPKTFYDAGSLEKYFRDLIKAEKEHFSTPAIPLMQGMDTSMPDPMELEMLEDIKGFLNDDEEVKISSMPEYVKALKGFLKGKKLKILKGEMKNPGEASYWTHLTGDIISTRPRQKALSAKAERMLQRWAEPFSTVATILGMEYPDSYLEMAWKNLLQCQAHDTIGGCGIDQLEKDATFRLEQAVNLSNMLMRTSMGLIQTKIDTSFCDENSVVLTVFNPSPFTRTEVVKAWVDVPEQTGITHIRITDEKGKEVDVFEGRRRDTEKIVRSNVDVTTSLKCNELEIQFFAKDVPGLGYKCYCIGDSEHAPLEKPLAASSREMENESLKVLFNDDGTLHLLDKKTGRKFRNMHYFEDQGEAGDPWQWKPPAKDRIISSIGSPVQISLEENSHLMAVVRVRYEMSIPVGLGHDTNHLETWRTEAEKPLIIESFFTLRKGSPYLEVETLLDNQHKNHRLRVMFPSEIQAKNSCAEQAFTVVEREIERGKDSAYRHTYNPTYPMLRFVDLSDEKQGLAVLSEGTREYEAVDDDKRTLALTLLRAFEIALCTVTYRWERLPEMQLSQAPGKHVFRYALYPHSGDWNKGEVMEIADRFNIPMLSAQSTPGMTEKLNSTKGFLEIKPKDIQLSGLKRSETDEEIVLRLYNPTDSDIDCEIETGFRLKTCEVVNMEEKSNSESFSVNWKGRKMSLQFPAQKVITLKLSPEKMIF